MAFYPGPRGVRRGSSGSFSDRLRSMLMQGQMQRGSSGSLSDILRSQQPPDMADAVEPQPAVPTQGPFMDMPGGEGAGTQDTGGQPLPMAQMNPGHRDVLGQIMQLLQSGQISTEDAVARWRQFRFGGASPQGSNQEGYR